MYKNKKILGVIVARGGSKGIPRKNIKELNGKPLIVYTIAAAKASQYLTSVILSTNDEETAQVSRDAGMDVPFLRPEELAQDTSSALSVIQHAVQWMKDNRGEEYDYVMILQPTSPLRLPEDIDACIQKIVDTEADSVMSMVELVDFSVKKLKKIENDVIVPLLEEEGKSSAQRDTLEKLYKRNAAIYLTKTECIQNNDLFGKISRPYVMPAERSVDINHPFDFLMAETILKKNKEI